MGTSRLNTFVTPKPHVGLIRALIPFNRLVNLKGIPLLRDIPYLNRLPIIRGLCDIREIDLDDASKALLAHAMNGKTSSFITPNHPEFFTDWMLDKEIASRFYPLTANWATHSIVNGMGKWGQKFWLANHLIAQVLGDTESALTYSKQAAAHGTPVLLHPEGQVLWQSDYINPLFHGAAQMALELARERPEKTVLIQPVVWKLRFTRNVSRELMQELAYVEQQLGLPQQPYLALPLRLAKVHRDVLKQTFTYLGYIAPKGLNYFDLRDALLNRINQDLQHRFGMFTGDTEEQSRQLLRAIRQDEKQGKPLDAMTVRKRRELQRLLRTPKAVYSTERWSQENIAECIKRLRNDYLKKGWRNALHHFVPRPVAGRIAHIRACEAIDIQALLKKQPDITADAIMNEVRLNMQAALDGLKQQFPATQTYANPFLL